MTPSSIIVLAELEASHAELTAALEAAGPLEVVATETDASALAGLVAAHEPAAIFLQLGEKADLYLDGIEAMAHPQPALLVSGPEDASGLILRAMRLGAREYLPPSMDAARLQRAVERLLVGTSGPAPVEPAPAGKAGSILAVMGSKGGVGATMVACQLAATLQRSSGNAALVDLNLQHGDVDLYLDIRPIYTIADMAQREGALDATYLRTLLQQHRSGLHVLAAPQLPEDAELVAGVHVERTLGLLRASHDWVVVDVPRGFDEACLSALDAADEILLVVSMDVPSLNHARRRLALLERLGHSAAKVRLIANRCSKKNAVGRRDLEEFIGRGPDAQLPNDFAATQESLNFGRLVSESAPRCALSRGFEALARSAYQWRGMTPPHAETVSGLHKAAEYLRKRLHGAH